MEERILGVEDTIEENIKSKKLQTQNIQKIWNTMKRPNLRKIGTEREESQHKNAENILKKSQKKIFLTLKNGAKSLQNTR